MSVVEEMDSKGRFLGEDDDKVVVVEVDDGVTSHGLLL